MYMLFWVYISLHTKLLTIQWLMQLFLNIICLYLCTANLHLNFTWADTDNIQRLSDVYCLKPYYLYLEAIFILKDLTFLIEIQIKTEQT